MGTAFLAPIMPALVLLSLPVLSWLAESRQKWRRWLLASWLLLTGLMQLPGVLVNFDYQEILDGKMGATYQDLLWRWPHSPLLTYWNKVFTGAANPVWLHPFFWQNDGRLLALLALLFVGIVALHGWLLWSGRRQSVKAASSGVLAVLAALTFLFGVGVVVASREDPRWWDSTENIAVNREVRAFVEGTASAADVVLLDLREAYDRPGRVWEWLNEASLRPDYIGFNRKPELAAVDTARLETWLSPYPRVWLVLQATSYAAPESTTENWLRTWAYEGRNQWLETQRVVEYLVPAEGDMLAEGTAVFRTDPPLSVQYTVAEGKTPAHILLDLAWQGGTPGLKYSVQALNADQSALLQQIDKPVRSGREEKVGVYLLEPDALLVLKVYDPATQTIFSMETAVGEVGESLILVKGNIEG